MISTPALAMIAKRQTRAGLLPVRQRSGWRASGEEQVAGERGKDGDYRDSSGVPCQTLRSSRRRKSLPIVLPESGEIGTVKRTRSGSKL